MSRLFDDGSNEYLEIDSSPVASEPFTLACWFYSDNIADRQSLICLADKDVADNYHSLRANGTGAGDPISALSYDGDSERASTSTGYSANTWHHACGVWAADNDRRAYIDGGSKGTNSNNQNVSGIDRISIGRNGDSTPANYMSGRIAEAAIWSAALTDAEVAILAKGYSPLFVRPQSLVAYWPLIRDEDQDRVGGYDLTAYNTPSIAVHLPMIYPAAPQYGVSTATGVSIPVITARKMLCGGLGGL
jgi:hypothetical protein